MMRKFSYKIRFGDIALLFLGFGLALFDMVMLQKGIGLIIPGLDVRKSSIAAVLLATIANTFALDWGIKNGRNKTKHIINKKSLFGFMAWVAFGIVYCIIELIMTQNAIANMRETPGSEIDTVWWIKQTGQYVALAFSYIFSGLGIQRSAREIWDTDASACRSAEAEYNFLKKKVAKDNSKINYMLTALENYNQNYKNLDEQYAKQAEAIHHAEDSVINEILGKTLQENESNTPSKAREVIERAKNDFRG